MKIEKWQIEYDRAKKVSQILWTFAEIKNISNFFTKYVKTNLLCLEGLGSNTFDWTRTTYTVDH